MPRVSTFLGVIFAIIAVLALLASISHTSKSLRASAVSREIVSELVGLVTETFPERAPAGGSTGDVGARPSGSATDTMTTDRGSPGHALQDQPGATLTSDRRGWVQQVSVDAIRKVIADRSSVRLDVSVGNYVFAGAPLLTIWPPPATDGVDDVMDDLRKAFAIGDERSMQQDVTFGFTLLEDIANKALSPGVNDPNTAAAVIEQLGEVMVALMEREPHPVEMTLDGCAFTRAAAAGYDDMVVAAFNQIRHYAKGDPAVQLVLVRTLVRIGDELIRRRADTDDAIDALRKMLRYVEADLAPPQRDPTAEAAYAELDDTIWYHPA